MSAYQEEENAAYPKQKISTYLCQQYYFNHLSNTIYEVKINLLKKEKLLLLHRKRLHTKRKIFGVSLILALHHEFDQHFLLQNVLHYDDLILNEKIHVIQMYL